MKLLLTMLTMMACSAACAQYGFESFRDKENGQTVYRGRISFEDVKGQLSFGWFKKGAEDYKPDTTVIKFLRKNLPGYNITIFLGTWCDDSQNMIPKLYKVMQMINYPMEKYIMYGVDRDKHSSGGEQKMYDIANVPTVILYKKNHEVGRITEFVQKSIEKDLQAIIESDMAR